MSAVVTKKLGGDYATQLTFPAVFELQAKANNLASQFYPDAKNRPMELLTGSGLQQDYHEQKRLDAHRRCLNGVKDNAASMARFLSSHANYIVPKPVLSQRIFANPSNGNQADIYSNRPQFNQMRGGVLRTEEGQKWAMQKLKERVPQLDAIKAAKEAFLLGTPMVSTGVESVGISDITAKVELYGLLNRVESDVEQGVVNNKTVEKSQNLLKLLFSWTPYGEVREVEEVMEKMEYIKRTLKGITEQGQEGVAISEAGEAIMKNAEYLKNLYDKMLEYLTRMNGVLNRPRKEREKASSIFIKSLGFSELEKKLPSVSAKVQRAIEAAEAANPNADPEGEEVEEERVIGEEEEEEEAPAPAPPRLMMPLPPYPRGPPAYEESAGLGTFDAYRFEEDRRRHLEELERRRGLARGESKEDEPEFDVDVRIPFAERSGAYFGEAAPEEIVGPRAAMESAELPIEEQPLEAPEFEPAVAAAAAAAAPPSATSSPREVRIVRPPKKEAAAAAASKRFRPATAEEALTPQELDNYRELEQAAAQYPAWLEWDSLQASKMEQTIANARAEGYTPRASSDAKSIKRSVTAKFRRQVAVLRGLKLYRDKIAAARVEVPSVTPLRKIGRKPIAPSAEEEKD